MANYKIEWVDAESILICRVEGFVDDVDALNLARDWRAAVIAARKASSKLRVLFDNSRGNVMSPKAVALMSESTRDLGSPGDRTAVLTANILAKLQARRTMKSEGEVFMSEKAARLWLAA